MEEKLFKLEEVAIMIDSSWKTINNWYQYKNEHPDDERTKILPEPQRGKKQTRYWTPEDVEVLRRFKESIPKGRNGFMGETTQKYYPKRKKEAKK